MKKTPSTVINRINDFNSDKSWMDQVRLYSGIREKEFSELLACFFHDRDREGYTLKLPDWAYALSGDELINKQNEIIKKRGWNTDMSLLGIIHLCYLAHAAYKKENHQNLLNHLEKKLEEKKKENINLLDYGCGASSFSQLALTFPRVFCTLSDVDPDVLEFLKWFFNEKWPGRFTTQKLNVLNNSLSKRSRIKVYFKEIKGTFDIIILADVLEHMLDPLSALLHFYSQLSAKGIFLIVYPKYVEGDWHTPEAFWMRKWCYLLLLLTCKREHGCFWHKKNEIVIKIFCFCFKLIHPLLIKRSKIFAYNYFQKNGDEIVSVVQNRAKRTITVSELLESI